MTIHIAGDYAVIDSRNLKARIEYVHVNEGTPQDAHVLTFIAKMHDKEVTLTASQIGVEDGEDMAISLLRGINVLLTRYKMVREKGR
jgi:hypothetical protein